MESPENALFRADDSYGTKLAVGVVRRRENPPHGGFLFFSFWLAGNELIDLEGWVIMDSAQAKHPSIETVALSSDDQSRASLDFQFLLGKAIQIIDRLGGHFASDSVKLATFRTQLEQGRFHLAVLGQFKRGKSTLLNAFLGQALLPTSVVPLTAIPTFLEYGPETWIRVCYQDERPNKEFHGKTNGEFIEILQGLVTEEGNPKNRHQVAQVEVYHPAAILRHGVVLIDTPGIGSTFTHNTEATLNFLPQCDAALFVVSADPPITEVEAEFLKQVELRQIRLFFIFNKIDYLDEQERETALTFFKKILTDKLGTDDFPIFSVSARRGLDARLFADTALWENSGLHGVENHLIYFLASEKANALREALGCKVREVLEDVVMRLKLGMRSLQMPLEDLSERLRVFEQELKNVERQRIEAQDLLAGDRKRTLARLEEAAEDMRKNSRDHLESVVDACFLALNGGEVTGDAVLDALAQEVAAFFQASAEEVSRDFGLYVTDALRPHQQRADALIELIRKAAAQLFDVPYRAPESSGAYTVKRRPYWVLRKRVPSLPIVVPEEAFDKLLPATLRITRLKKRLSRQIESLVRHNVENLRWATLQNLNDAYKRFGLTLDQRFQET